MHQVTVLQRKSDLGEYVLYNMKFSILHWKLRMVRTNRKYQRKRKAEDVSFAREAFPFECIMFALGLHHIVLLEDVLHNLVYRYLVYKTSLRDRLTNCSLVLKSLQVRLHQKRSHRN